MKAYIVNAFHNRRATVVDKIKEQSGCEPVVVPAPEGRAVRHWGPMIWKADLRWREPDAAALDRSLMTWGELACCAGHYDAWKRIADSGETAVVVEDDVKVLRRFPTLDELPGAHLNQPFSGLAYLGGLPMSEADRSFLDSAGPAKKPWAEASDIYWAVAYIIDPSTAREFVDRFPAHSAIPLDEWLPMCYGPPNPRVRSEFFSPTWRPPRIHAWIPGDWYATQERLAAWPSGTENSSPAFDLTVLCCTSDLERAKPTLESFGKLKFHVEICETDQEWDTEQPGGWPKIDAYRRALNRLDSSKLALLADAWDVRALGTPEQLLEGWAILTERNARELPAVIGGEQGCWPPPLNACDRRAERLPDHERTGTGPYRYPNSGLVIGPVPTLRQLLAAPHFRGDDQKFWQMRVLESMHSTQVDSEARLFGNLHECRDHYRLKNGYPFNLKTGYWPRILHAHGPDKRLGLDQFEPFQEQEQSDPKLPKVLADRDYAAKNDIITLELLDPAEAEHMGLVALKLQGWKALDGDQYPNDELRLSYIRDHIDSETDLLGWLSDQVLPRIDRAFNAHFPSATLGSVGDAFFSRSVAGQPTLDLHNDSSHVSISILLRKAHSGGRLQFPRQVFDDGDSPCGTAVVWPGAISHPHRISPVQEGTRVSLIIWTKL